MYGFMRIKILVVLLGIVAGSANADSFEVEPSLSANVSWKFGGSQPAIPALGLQARYGSAFGPSMQLADIQWRAGKTEQMGFNAAVMGVPVVVDSSRVNATAGGVAKGIGIATVTTVVVGLAVASVLVAKAFEDAPESIARCAARNCDNENNDEGDDEEDNSSDDNQFPGI